MGCVGEIGDPGAGEVVVVDVAACDLAVGGISRCAALREDGPGLGCCGGNENFYDLWWGAKLLPIVLVSRKAICLKIISEFRNCLRS